MPFENDKRVILSKIDKSNKGDWDVGIIPLCDLINKDPNFYTTSSCAGRIVLMTQPESGKKTGSAWIFVSHEKVAFDDLKDSLYAYTGKEDVWLRAEGMILHVRCKSTEYAKKLLDNARSVGLKRSGIISVGPKCIVEALSVEKVDTIVAKKGQILVDDAYLMTLLGEANKKLLKTHERIHRFMEALGQN